MGLCIEKLIDLSFSNNMQSRLSVSHLGGHVAVCAVIIVTI